MHKSYVLCYKNLSVHSDGCVTLNTKLISLKTKKKVFLYEKDHKFFLKALKNKMLIKKKIAYRNKIF